jgi:uncharacterized protein YjdB
MYRSYSCPWSRHECKPDKGIVFCFDTDQGLKGNEFKTRKKEKKYMSRKKLSIGLLFLAVALAALPGASATPAFYGDLQSIYGGPTSCQADCHNPVTFVFTSYGDAFKAVPTHSTDPTSALIAIGPPLATIKVTPSTASLTVPGTQTFTAATLDPFGNQIKAAVTWKSSKTRVGTITSAGLFTAIGAGTATITATGGGTGSGTITGTATATVSATVSAPSPAPVLTTVTISPLNPKVSAGRTKQFTATTLDQNNAPIGATLSWTSSNTSVGTITSTGLFKAVSQGTTTITVTAVNGSTTAKNSTIVTVSSSTQVSGLTTVTISPLTPTVQIPDTLQFLANALDQNKASIGATLTWSSSDPANGTINSTTGLFKAVGPGTTTITVTAVNGSTTVTNSTKVSVTEPNQNSEVKTIKVSPPKAKIVVGKSRTFIATAFDQFKQAISVIFTWSSSNTTVGTIDNTGKFTSLAEGTTTITATNGTINGSAFVTVKALSSGKKHGEIEEDEHEQNGHKDVKHIEKENKGSKHKDQQHEIEEDTEKD